MAHEKINGDLTRLATIAIVGAVLVALAASYIVALSDIRAILHGTWHLDPATNDIKVKIDKK